MAHGSAELDSLRRAPSHHKHCLFVSGAQTEGLHALCQPSPRCGSIPILMKSTMLDHRAVLQIRMCWSCGCSEADVWLRARYLCRRRRTPCCSCQPFPATLTWARHGSLCLVCTEICCNRLAASALAGKEQKSAFWYKLLGNIKLIRMTAST